MGIHWFILSALVVMFAQRWVFKRFGIKRLTYKRTFGTARCFEGDRIEMIEKVTNRGLLPVPWLRVESQLHTGLKFESEFNFDVSSGQFYQNHKSLFSLMGYKQLTRRHAVLCNQRGCYRLTSASLTYGDLFGFYRAWVNVPLSEELIVYPKPLDRADIQLPSHSWQGDISVRRWIVEDPFFVTGVRDYRPGDPLKGINWSATARAGQIQVHRRDFTADYRLMVVLNVEDHTDMWDTVNDTELIEQGIRCAAGYIQYATEQGLESGFASNGHELDIPGKPMIEEMGSGHEHLMAILEQMAKLVIVRAMPFDALLAYIGTTLDARCDLVIVSAFMNDKITAEVERLRHGGHGIHWVPIGRSEEAA
ncbi:DUF58 domain-containing protein [Paenibacillus mendelii]|uniref:DUF58 domain-containing protein n=1 Tax=Paenibacillus mendelii TaxID=206163 RepID=A0ABV6J7H6_9BACL|nr:DUF58 domain-containing protein [Paenibacillus mendelii]MCQ6562091.1 DUF58 domain-containing protein [Paenibacillus mendelii]